MNVITTKRTQGENKDFNHLIAQLDNDFNEPYQREQSEYDKFNKVDSISTVVVAFDGDKPVGCGCFKEYDSFTSLYFRYFPEYDQFRAGCRSDECISEDYGRYFCDDRSLVVYSVFYRRYGR